MIADDDDGIRGALVDLFVRDGFAVASVADGDRLVEYLEACQRHLWLPDAIVTDHRMPLRSSIDVLRHMNVEGWDVPVIVITAFGTEVRDMATALGAQAVIDKPFDFDQVRSEVTCAIDWTHRRLAAWTPRM